MFFTEHVGRWWLLSYLPVANLLTCSLQNTSAAGGYSPIYRTLLLTCSCTEHVGRWWLLSYLPVANLLTCYLQNTSAAGGYSPIYLLLTC